MCGRFTLTSSADVVAELFELSQPPTFTPRYNIAPTQGVVAVLPDAGGGRTTAVLHWGLVPSWAKDPGIGSRMINARAETVASKPSFRTAFQRRRCLIVADGFYEWQKLGKTKQPHYIAMQDGRPFAFAGLREHWVGPDGSVIDSCTIITTEPNELMAPLHNRMPVILPADEYATWLDPSLEAADRLEPLLCPYPTDEMRAIPVSTHVNSPAHDDAQCVRPI